MVKSWLLFQSRFNSLYLDGSSKLSVTHVSVELKDPHTYIQVGKTPIQINK